MSDAENANARLLELPSISRVADTGLAEWGRKEIRLAEKEMPGLMALRAEHRRDRPLAGARIAGSVHLTVQTAVLIETLVELGAEVTWTSCNPQSTQDHAAAAVAVRGLPIFAWKGQTPEDYVWCLRQQLTAFSGGRGPNLLLDDGGDLTELVHRDYPSLFEGDDPLRGVSEETTAGVSRLKRLLEEERLRVPAVSVNDSVTKSKFDNFYGIRESLLDGLKRATDIMVAGKVVVVVGFGHVGKGAAQGMRGMGARVLVCEVDPICALQAAMEGYEVVTMEDAAARGDIFVTATGVPRVIRGEHLSRMKDQAICVNIGAFDHEIDVAWLLSEPSIRLEPIKDDVDAFVFSDGHRVIVPCRGRIVNLGCATGHSSFVMSCSFTNQVLAQLALWTGPELPVGIHRLPRHLDEKVAALHLPALGARVDRLTDEQARFLLVEVDGPFKTDEYRY